MIEKGSGMYLMMWWEMCAYAVMAVPELTFTADLHEGGMVEGEEYSLDKVSLILEHPELGKILVAGAGPVAEFRNGNQMTRMSLSGVQEGGPEELIESILKRAGLIGDNNSKPGTQAYNVAVSWVMLKDAIEYGFGSDFLDTFHLIAGPKWLVKFPDGSNIKDHKDVWQPWAFLADERAKLDINEGWFDAGRFGIPFAIPVRSLPLWNSVVSKSEKIRKRLKPPRIGDLGRVH